MLRRLKTNRLPLKEILDLDEHEKSRKATVSLFNSLPPQILVVDDFKEEASIISGLI